MEQGELLFPKAGTPFSQVGRYRKGPRVPNLRIDRQQPKSRLKHVEQRRVSKLADLNFNIRYHTGKQSMNADSLSHHNWVKHQECYIGKVEAALICSLSTTAVPDESVREQLLQSAWSSQ